MENFKAFYHRADLSNYTENEYPVLTPIRSESELLDYYRSNKDTYQFDRQYSGSTDMAGEVFAGNGLYDEAFFKNHFLLFIVLEEGSGSVRHKVESVTRVNGSLSVNIVRIIPEIGTCDMAQWHIIVVLDRAISDSDIDIGVSITGC